MFLNLDFQGQVSHLKPSLVPEVTALASELESSCQQFIAAGKLVILNFTCIT